jgi:hypothetical protein
VTDEPQRRRSSDRELAILGTRLTVVEGDTKRILEAQQSNTVKLDGIKEAMGDLQASPLGREIIALKAEVRDLNAFRSEMIGAAKFSRLVQLILGIALAIITLLQVADRTVP